MTSTLIPAGYFRHILLLDMGGYSFTNIVLLILFALVLYAVFNANSRAIKVVHSHWHHMFETVPFTPMEFYQSLQKEIEQKGIPGLSFTSIKHSEGGILSANREYLRVRFRDYMMDICAAPFAKESFFVSWWLGDVGVTFRDILTGIPMIGRLFNRREKTFYEQDTEIMFKETVARSVKNTIESLSESKGVRQPDLTDWRGSAIEFKTK